MFFSRNPSSSILMHWSMKRDVQLCGATSVISFCVRENTWNSFGFWLYSSYCKENYYFYFN